MTFKQLFLAALTLSSAVQLSAIIIKISSIAELVQYIDDETLLLVDLDRTLIIINHTTNLAVPMEATTVGIIQSLQDQNFSIIGLTSRYQRFKKITVTDLTSNNIDLTKTALPMPEDLTAQFENYHEGILFCNEEGKGNHLKIFLTALTHKPKK